MAEKLNTPVIYLKLGTPVIRLYDDTNKLNAPLIRLVEVSGNILESCKVTSPHGREDECARFTISDIEDAYGLREIMAIGTEYTLSFWLKSDVSGYVRTSGEGTFKTSSEWQKCVVTFDAEDEDLVLSFDKEGTYYIYHIQLELGNTATDYRPANEDVDEGISTAQKTAEEAQEKARQNAEALASAVEEFQDQIDAHVMIWYGEGAPTSDNPDLKWEDAETKALHKGDMYYDTKTGYAYRWEFESSAYSWKQIEDQDVKKALEDSAKAQGSADQKRRVFVTQPEPPYDEGDLWLNDGELYSCIKPKTEGVYEDGDFKVAVKYTNELNLFKGQYANELKAINDQIDKKAETWYQEEDPSSAWTTDELRAAHVGDFWYNTKENKSYIYRFSESSTDLADPVDGKLATPYITINGYGWKESDGVPQSVYDKIDKKAQIFSDKPTHPYYVKDLWVEGAEGDIKVCIENSTEEGFKEEHWVLASRYMGNAELQNWITQKYNPVIQEVKLQLDGKAETWCQTTDPSLKWDTEDKRRLHIGDLWLNPNTKESYIYTASISDRKTSTPASKQLAIPYIGLYSWKPTFEIPQSVFQDIDGKAQIFATQPKPPYFENDLWTQGADGDIYVCITDRTEGNFVAEDWKKASGASRTATDYLKAFEDSLIVGDVKASKLGKNVLIEGEGVKVRDNETVLASFEANVIKLGLDNDPDNDKYSYIDLCNETGVMSAKIWRDDYDNEYKSLSLQSPHTNIIGNRGVLIESSSLYQDETLTAGDSSTAHIWLETQELVEGDYRASVNINAGHQPTNSSASISLYANDYSRGASLTSVAEDGVGSIDVRPQSVAAYVMSSPIGDIETAVEINSDGVLIEGDTIVDGSLDVGGDISVNGNLSGDISVDGSLSVSGDTSVDGSLSVDGDVNFTNALPIEQGGTGASTREQALLALLGYTPSYIQVRTTADETTWSSSHQYMYPFCADAAPSTWSSVKGNLSLDTQVLSFGDRENVTVYGVRVGKNIHMVKVNASVYFSSASETVTGVAASIYRLQDGKNVIFSQAFTHVDSGNGTYGTCSPSAIMAVKEGDFIFIGGWKSTANRDINTPAGSGRTNMIVEAIG